MPVGPRKDEFMSTVAGGPADAPALVMIPGQQRRSNKRGKNLEVVLCSGIAPRLCPSNCSVCCTAPLCAAGGRAE